jgi:hypothetical protein
MLPNLASLRLVSDQQDTSAKTAKQLKEEKEEAKRLEKEAKRKQLIKKNRKAKAANANRNPGTSGGDMEVEDMSEPFIEEEYPHKALNTLDGLDEILDLEKKIRLSKDTSMWIFSSISTMHAIRLDDEEDPELVETIAKAGDRFANKPFTEGECGSFNCFEANVPIGGDEAWALALRTAIQTLNPHSPRFKMPETVSVRAPQRSQKYIRDDEATLEERMELALTLFMASTKISIPVFAALPVNVLSQNDIKNVVARGFMYVTESGWTDFQEVLDNLRAEVSAEEYDDAARSISSNVVALVERVAEHTIVLSDVKLINMVAKRNPTTKQFDVKMIDFSPIFTADLNMNYPGGGVKPTSKECAFFLNGLLLISYVFRNARFHVSFFKELAARVVEAWREMIQNGKSGGFCWFLAKDKVFPPRQVRAINMVGLPDGEFEDTLKNAFYLVLSTYGRADIIKSMEQIVPPDQYESYITRLVNRLALKFGV